jgi:hypothetical protein
VSYFVILSAAKDLALWRVCLQASNAGASVENSSLQQLPLRKTHEKPLADDLIQRELHNAHGARLEQFREQLAHGVLRDYRLDRKPLDAL